MGNDIEIRVKVANNTATGLAAVNRSLNRLRDEANDAGRGLDGLAARATAASVALRALKDSAQDASRALRSLNTAARNADGRMSTMSDRSRALRRDTDDLDGSMRSLTTTMGGLRGNNGRLNASFGNSGDSMQKLKAAAIALSPALIPVAAAAVPIATSFTAAGVAVSVFGLAIAGQVSAVSKASDAQKKYDEAVKKHGPASKEAAQAEALFLDQVRGMDPATRRAAAALVVLKDQYKQWSKSLAGDTMPVFTKGLAVAGGLLPKLTPMVKGAAGELDRFMTILAGGVNSGGFSAFMDSFAKFSTGALSKANDALVHFMRTMSGAAGKSQFSEFMEYVKTAGPQVRQALASLSKALVHVVAAASDTGLSMLSFVNAIAKLVNAIPSGVLSTFLQFAVALKAVKLAAAGLGALGGLSGLGATLSGLVLASAQAGGGLRGLAAAFGTLSRSAKVALIGSGIGLLVVALSSLAEIGQKVPPDVDKLSTSLKGLAETGKNTGESVRVWGTGFEGLSESISRLDPEGFDGFLQGWAKFLGTDSTSVKTAKEDIDSLDKSLADLVKGGKADVAAKALEQVGKKLSPKDFKTLKSSLDDYKSALADQALEAKLTAESQGLFGQAAQATAAKLDAQKASADGLRQSIQALNDVNRAGLGGLIGFEAAIDAAAKAAKDNAGALSMTHGELDLNSEKARNAASALQDLADKTDSAAASARESGSSWGTVNGIYARGRSQLIKSAQAMGLTAQEAAQLADQILKIPDKTARVKMNAEDAKRGLNAFNAAVKRAPGSKSVTLKTLSSSAEKVLRSFGYKVTHLKNGSVRVSAATGGALSGIRNVRSAVNSLRDKTVTISTYMRTFKSIETFRAAHGRASGGLVPRYADGGNVQAFPDGGFVQGPGSGTSDSILGMFGSGAMARISNTEYVVRAAAVKKYGVEFLDALNSGRLKVAGLARGGLTKKQQAARKAAEKEREARQAATPELTITHFGRKAGYKNPEIRNQLRAQDSIGPLVSALNQWRGTIMKSTHGGTERSLLRRLDAAGGALIKYQRNLDKVNKSLEKAKDKLDDLKSAASQLSSGVKSGILSGANITRAAGAEDSRLTINTLLSQMTGSAANSKQFASMLKQLKGRGLRGDLIEQIAEAGIEGGGMETAAAVLGGGKEPIRRLNELQKQITANAKAAGSTAADAMYGVGLKAAEGLVKGLTSQQNRIEATMLIIAKSMEKSIKKALGIRSPSKVMEPVGEFSMRGVEVGWSKRLAKGHTMLSGKTPAWASMLNAPRAGTAGPAAAGPAAPASSAGARPIVLNVSLAGREFGQIWVDVGRKEVSTRGGLRATLGGMD